MPRYSNISTALQIYTKVEVTDTVNYKLKDMLQNQLILLILTKCFHVKHKKKSYNN